MQPVVRTFDPLRPEPHRGPMDLWTFRRIADRKNFEEGAYDNDLILVNWPQIDYLKGPLVGVPEDGFQATSKGPPSEPVHAVLDADRSPAPRWRDRLARLATAPRCHGTPTVWPAPLHPRVTSFAACSGWKNNMSACRPEWNSPGEVLGSDCRTLPDTVGIGAYRIDLHPSTGDNYIDVSSSFQIRWVPDPLRVENLLAGAKNLSVTPSPTDVIACIRGMERRRGLRAPGRLLPGKPPYPPTGAPILASSRISRPSDQRGVEHRWPVPEPL